MIPVVKNYPSPFLATFAAVALCGVVPLLLWNMGAPVLQPNALLAVTAIIVISGLKFALVLGYRDRRLHEMVLWLFVYLFLGVAPFVQIQTTYPGTTPGMDSVFAVRAATVVLVGCLAILLGLGLGNRRAEDPNYAPVSRPVNARNVYLLALATLLLAVFYVSQVGFSTLFAARSELSSARSDSLGGPFGTLIVAGAKMGLLVAFVALASLWRQRKRAQQPRPVFMTVVVLVTLVALVNPVGNARYIFGTVALAVLGALGLYATIGRFRAAAVGAMAGMIVVFPILDTFRRTLDATVELQSPLDSLTSADFDAFAQLMNTVRYVEEQGITWGNQLLGVVLFWVPREGWAEKPIDTGTFLAEWQDYRFRNLSAPLWAELYINLGWVGLIAGMIGFGYLIRYLDRRSEAMLSLYGAPGVAATIIPFYLLIVLRGSLLQAMSNLLIILVASWFVTRPQRDPFQVPRRRPQEQDLSRV
ncbi:O-antigen polysaccharide polymerase Wzy [Microbacterium allomyrinae]|uniref:O-antigen polysaccharide polymerase Wzy n=1 Tax=Microbacterium allomyrinae TaxID=2830666 RepID=A0A9X1S3D7_9MICO|nr:O-antigen polysaccharide polymerase Wzy [Microbacterium allomyrinae]MCC2031843.1 O-antigen polysaccharide polymerase Wzy [Microbacterium allomyrinae]